MIGKIIIGIIATGSVAAPVATITVNATHNKKTKIDNGLIERKKVLTENKQNGIFELVKGGYQLRLDLVGATHWYSRAIYIWGKNKADAYAHANEFLDLDQQNWIDSLRETTGYEELVELLISWIEKDNSFRYEISKETLNEEYVLHDYHYVNNKYYTMNTMNRDINGKYKLDMEMIYQDENKILGRGTNE